jgi:hypothetical protein
LGFLEVLTIVFVILKALGYVDWSWWVVFSPVIAAVAIYVVLGGFALIGFLTGKRQMKRQFGRMY